MATMGSRTAGLLGNCGRLFHRHSGDQCLGHARALLAFRMLSSSMDGANTRARALVTTSSLGARTQPLFTLNAKRLYCVASDIVADGSGGVDAEQMMTPVSTRWNKVSKPITAQVSQYGLTFEIGKFQAAADGCAVVHSGNTTVLATAIIQPMPRNKTIRSRSDPVNLTVSVKERMAAAGRLPLNHSMVDTPTKASRDLELLMKRCLLPYFPSDLSDAVHIAVSTQSIDCENYDLEVLALNAASAALLSTGLPMFSPISAVRIALADNETTVFSSPETIQTADASLLFVGHKDITHVSGQCNLLPYVKLPSMIKLAKAALQTVDKAQRDLWREAGAKRVLYPATIDADLLDTVHETSRGSLISIFNSQNDAPTTGTGNSNSGGCEKEAGSKSIADLPVAVSEWFADSVSWTAKMHPFAMPETVRVAVWDLFYTLYRKHDWSPNKPIYATSASVDVFATPHGSASFCVDGDSQVLCTTTLGPEESLNKELSFTTTKRRQFVVTIDPLSHATMPTPSGGDRGNAFNLNNVLTPYHTPEEIHGLSIFMERAFNPVLPKVPFTIRIATELLNSGANTTTATSCAMTLALLDGGVPLAGHIAASTMCVIVAANGHYKMITRPSAMDFAMTDGMLTVAGTDEHVTAIEYGFTSMLDQVVSTREKVPLYDMVLRQRDLRAKCIVSMKKLLPNNRTTPKPNAPAVAQMVIQKGEKLKLIGSRGTNLARLQSQGASLEISESLVTVVAPNSTIAKQVKQDINILMERFQLDSVYTAEVAATRKAGCVIDIGSNVTNTFLVVTKDVCVPSRVAGLDKEQKKDARNLIKVGEKLRVVYRGKSNEQHRFVLEGIDNAQDKASNGSK